MSETLQAYNCSTCSLSFSSDVRYKEHYKSDFHRYNLKRQLISLPSVSVEQYEKRKIGFTVRVRLVDQQKHIPN